jgi:hypothetical protein
MGDTNVIWYKVSPPSLNFGLGESKCNILETHSIMYWPHNLGNDTCYNVLPKPCVIAKLEWVKANIVEDKMLEIDCEVLREVYKFIIWLWDSINIYGLHSTSTWVTPMMCSKYLGVSIVMWDEIHGLACGHEFPTCTYHFGNQNIDNVLSKPLWKMFKSTTCLVKIINEILDVVNESWMQKN